MQIDHDAAEFPFSQLAGIIRGRIASGEYPRGSKLPTLNEIVSLTGLAPTTIRRAYAVLTDEGLVQVVPGRGTYVV